MHALLQKHGAKTKRASEPPAMAPCHANDVESGHCTPASSSGVHQLARASDQVGMENINPTPNMQILHRAFAGNIV
eukprot:1158092-Pelagomonas_calceolata.AAC.3